MTEISIITQSPAIVEVLPGDSPVVEAVAAGPAVVEILSEGIQGPPGDGAVVPDPGDLTLYFQNGLT